MQQQVTHTTFGTWKCDAVEQTKLKTVGVVLEPAGWRLDGFLEA